jgi:DNA adenine methylase
MTDAQHAESLDMIGQCRGRVLISSYDSPLYTNHLKDWARIEKSTHVQFSNSGRNRLEVLWKNW